MKRSTQLLRKILLIVTLFLTVSCDFIGSLRPDKATPSPEVTPPVMEPTAVPYPPLPAPKLIDRTPAAHEPQALDEPLELVFDQPMDQQSVSRAFDIRPGIGGELTWANARTLRFTPADTFDRGTAYRVTVGETARNQEGEALVEPVAFEFTTVGFVEIAEVQPAPDSEAIDPDTVITVIFSRPMVPLTSIDRQDELPAPLALEPPVAGKGEWINTTIYRFYPDRGLAPSTSYTARIAAGLVDSQGAVLEEPYEWSFSTVGPMPVAWSPESNGQYVGVGDVISITFNQPMDRASVQAAFALHVNETPVNGAFRWLGGTGLLDEETLLFTPSEPFPRTAYIEASVRSGATARDNPDAIVDPWSWSFWIVLEPAILTTTPQNSERGVDVMADVEFQFAGPMQADAFLDHVSIIPEPTEVYTYWYELNTGVRLSFPKSPATTYRVTVDADAPDRDGTPLGKSLSLTFTTGDLSPYAAFNAPDSIGTFDAYTDTVVYARHRNVTRLNVALYRLSLDTFMRLHGYGSWEYRTNFRPAETDLVRQWSITPDAPRNTSALQRIELVDAQSAQLAPGIYILELSAPEVMARSSDAKPETFTFVRSAINLVLKQAQSEALVWATDLATGEPVARLPISLYRASKTIETSGSTDRDGLYLATDLANIDQWEDAFAVAGTPGDAKFAVAYNSWDSGIQPWDFDLNSQYGTSSMVGYLYTDRPIYRPGQTVHFKGIIRRDDDADYAIPTDVRTLEVRVTDPQGREVYREAVPVNDMGTFSDELLLGEEAPLGGYYLQLQDEVFEFYEGTSFRVAEYRKPDFEIAIETDDVDTLDGDTLGVDVAASYYFGGPVANAALTWNVLSAPFDFTYRCPEGTVCPNYSWSDYDASEDYGEFYGSYGRLVASGTTTTDAQGNASFRVSANIAEEISSRTFTIEASITDINGQEVSQRTIATIHRGSFYIGLAAEQTVAEAGRPQRVEILTADRDSQPAPGVGVEVVMMERQWLSVREESESGYAYWTWTAEDTPVYTTTVVSDRNGKAEVSFVPERSGTYRVRASARDTGPNGTGNDIRSSTYLWVWGGGEAFWRRESTNRIELVADRDLYDVGDVAEILIASPYSGTVQALITQERGHILETEVRELQGTTEVLRVPITEACVPNVYVSVVLMQGSGQTPERLATFKMGEVMLAVSTETKALQIALTPDRDLSAGETYRPRETAVYDVHVTDNTGRPVQAELSLRLADLAVLALAEDVGPTLMERFWSQRGLGVRTSTPLAVAMEVYNRELAPGIKGGGGGGEDNLGFVRTRFADTAFWAAVVTTDANGHARVEVELPDNLTTWRMQARAVTADTRVGHTDVDIRTALDLSVRPVLPRFFVTGDRAEIATIVQNATTEAIEASVSIAAQGLTIDSATEQSIAIPAGGEVRIPWTVTALAGAQVKVRMEARAGTLFDGREDVLPLYAFATPETIATAGRISAPGLQQEVVQLPYDFDPTQGELTVQIDGSLTAAAQGALDYLEHYPYECVEQTVSRFLPNVLTYQALVEMGLTRPELERELSTQVSVAMQRLYNEQHYDGGWGWWISDASDAYLTAYVLQGMLEAYRAGFTVDTDVIDRAAAHLREALPTITQASPQWEANRFAYELTVLGEYVSLVPGAESEGELGRATTLFRQRDRLSTYGKALLVTALGLLEPQEDSRVSTLLTDLAGDAIQSATGTHWEEAEPDYRNMNTDVRTTAMVLWAMARHLPESEMLPGAVRWLMDVRKESYWESTHTTSWALMALIATMRATGELQGDYSYTVSLNGEILLGGDVNAETIGDTQQIQVQIADLLVDQANRLIIERQLPAGDQSGEGQLYYTAALRTFVPVETVRALDRGIVVARQYSLTDAPDKLVSEAAVGDTIRVKVTVVAPTDLYYVTVEDPLPAGCEAVDVTLNTTSVVGEAPMVENLTLQEEDAWYRWYGWGWWWFSNSEMRDEKVTLFSTYLPRGTYEYTYVMRASVPGTYHVMPTTAYEMYYPEVFGRSDGGEFVVQGE